MPFIPEGADHIDMALPKYPKIHTGKVRETYDMQDALLLLATNRVSAYDWVLRTPIPGKGKLLTQMTLFWLQFTSERLNIRHHLLSGNDEEILNRYPDLEQYQKQIRGRMMLVQKLNMIPIEAVCRGYLAGSAETEYLENQGKVCGQQLPSGLLKASPLPETLFTPATKATDGHDVNITLAEAMDMLNSDEVFLMNQVRNKSIELFEEASRYAAARGIILADTKFEWGRSNDPPVLRPTTVRQVVLADEVLTPDSSRFWPMEGHTPGSPPKSFDKQFLRDWLTQSGWDKNSMPPEIPQEVVRDLQEKYAQAFDLLAA